MKWCLTAVVLLFMNLNLPGASRDADWKRVRDAMEKNLPRTAITNLEPIISAALKERAYPEAVKAIGLRIALEGTIEGNKPEERIPRLEKAIGGASAEMKPVMEALLAHWYWAYFQQNRWRFMQRTATAQIPGTDFTTWDLPRLFSEIDLHFQRALAAEDALKKVPVSTWDPLLQKGTMPDAYRPTLFDFIVYQALEFYTSGEQAATKAQDAFELDAKSPIFDSTEKFVQWNVGQAFQPNFPSPTINAIALYQKLLRLHQQDPEPKLAFAAGDLERLTWGWNAAFGPEKAERYKVALRDFMRRYADFEISALGVERLARVLSGEGDLAGAREAAMKAAQVFPESPGGKLCRNIVTEIEAKSVSISTERVWNAPWPDIKVTYRNIDMVYFRAIAYDWSLFLDRRRNRPEYLNDRERREILQKSPALEWNSELPPTTDYKERTAKLAAPSSLAPGFYFIISSHKPDFSEAQNVVSMTDVWVSDLALVTRSREGKLEGFVLEANSGEPVSGATVDAWYLNQQLARIAVPSVSTDTNGFFSFEPQANRGYLLRARYEGRQIASADEITTYTPGENNRPRGQSVLFTDRAIYRPGQMIQYKGIAVWVDQSKDNYELLKGEEVTVVFSDTNGKEVARQKRKANDYGSFYGSFTAPRDRLMGQMYLQAQGRAPGQAPIRVEEYKRPKFQVTLDAPKTAPKLNEKVVLTGHAMGYTGAAVDGAGVTYRVVRQVQMPWWWGPWGRRSWRPPESQEIAHGSVTTAADGAFTIEFTARPDLQVLEKDEPSFIFQVNADVTDNSGETRSAERNFRIGYTSLEARISAQDWQQDDKPVEMTITTRTLDGEPQVAEGSVKVYELEQPASVQRTSIADVYYGRMMSPYSFGSRGSLTGEDEENDLSNPASWPLGRMVQETGFTTGTNGEARITVKLGRGPYRAVLSTQDRFGKAVTGKLGLIVLKPDAPELGMKLPSLLAAPNWEVQPGDEFLGLWGTGYGAGRAFIEVEHRRQLILRFWTSPGRTQQQIKLAITEAMRGGVQLHITRVRENRAYLENRVIQVPWKNKELELKWEHFVSKLKPGPNETWTLQVRALQLAGAGKAEKTAAELVATLYDESLDAFAGLSWLPRFDIFRRDYSTIAAQFANVARHFNPFLGGWGQKMEQVIITYRSFPPELQQERYGGPRLMRGLSLNGASRVALAATPMSAAAQPAAGLAMEKGPVLYDKLVAGRALAGEAPAEPKLPSVPLDQVTARKNLNETAFFYPHLVSDSNGVVRITFTMPEALTKWRFLGFAHDSQLRSGLLEDHAVTAKDLMVQPNPPRFLREGDTVEFVVKVSNQSEREQTGRVRLNFNLAENEQPADKLLANDKPEQTFSLPAKQSRSFSWRITVPDGCGFLTYKAVGATDTVSDGEEGAVPVLSRRILVTESLPLPIRGPGTKTFEFTKLLKSAGSKTLRNEGLTVQMVSNPAWYAVLALPYLMEYPYECSEQVFNRFYANALARNIANSDPKIRRIFDQWKNTPTLDSPLEKNQDLKAVALEETPWLRQAQNESQSRRNVGILFDDNRLTYEQGSTLRKLSEMQLPDGAWPWFPGGQGNDYITLYITSGFGRLRHLGVDVDVSPAVRSLQRLDNWMNERYGQIQKSSEPEKYVPSATDALYLYGRSFFLKDMGIQDPHKAAIAFFIKQARTVWTKTGNRQTEGHLALALKRFSQVAGTQDTTPNDIMKSLRERSVSNEEMGMFWRDTELSWWWYRAPIETQALMIEAFDEVANDQKAVEDCRVWLLKQKQTQDWKTTKATSDAVYALLLRGRNLLSSEALVQVKLGGTDLTPTSGAARQPNRVQQRGTTSAAEPGTGFYEVKFPGLEVKPRMGEIVVKKTDPGVAWGSVNWRYLEDMSKVTPYEGTPLKLQKALYRKTATNRGQVLQPVTGPLAVGDELVVRIELRVDRDMEYVHMKDQRGSGTEPVNVLSGYKYQDGLGYYESTRDTATHFFIDYLPKGNYVFEYSTRVQLRGEYQTGVTQIQCMYAPEFNSHSGSVQLTVK